MATTTQGLSFPGNRSAALLPWGPQSAVVWKPFPGDLEAPWWRCAPEPPRGAGGWPPPALGRTRPAFQGLLPGPTVLRGGLPREDRTLWRFPQHLAKNLGVIGGVVSPEGRTRPPGRRKHRPGTEGSPVVLTLLVDSPSGLGFPLEPPPPPRDHLLWGAFVSNWGGGTQSRGARQGEGRAQTCTRSPGSPRAS